LTSIISVNLLCKLLGLLAQVVKSCSVENGKGRLERVSLLLFLRADDRSFGCYRDEVVVATDAARACEANALVEFRAARIMIAAMKRLLVVFIFF